MRAVSHERLQVTSTVVAEARTRRTRATGAGARLLLGACVFAAMLAFVAARSWMDNGGGAAERASTASVHETLAARTARLEARAAASPDDAATLSELALTYLQRARESGDPSFYPLAERAAQRALMLSPDAPVALTAAAAIAASKHDFAGTLALADRATAGEPSLAAAHAVRTDALVELGRYDEAVAEAQALADIRPDFAAYSRISYLRELHGDLPGAVDAMRQAAAAGAAVPQDVVWGRVLTGNLLLTSGDVEGAAAEYGRASALLPDDPNARAGQARLALARGDFAAAEQALRAAIDVRPLPEYVALLGDVLASQGRDAEARQQYDTVRAIERLFAANGVDTDLELALFEADHGGDPEAAYAQARTAYARRPSITAADAVAWTAYRAGRLDEARAMIAKARALGTRDARIAYHAGVIALASGDAATARSALEAALTARGMLTPAEYDAAAGALVSLNGRPADAGGARG